VRGRRQGRAFHAVRLHDDIFLDLVEMVRVLPVVGCDLIARGIHSREVTFHADLEALQSASGHTGEALDVSAAWLLGGDGGRVIPESEGAAVFSVAIDGGRLEVLAWMPAVARGIARDRLEWAGVATWRRDGVVVVDAGATPRTVLAALGLEVETIRAASLETWRWSRDELIEVAGVAHHLEGQGVDIAALLDDAFADGTVPVPAGPEDTTVVAAVLNWRGAVARRSGRTRHAVAVFDAALAVCGPDDDDNRADIHYNRGYARLQGLMAGPRKPRATAS
jgi:hypothetical protein